MRISYGLIAALAATAIVCAKLWSDRESPPTVSQPATQVGPPLMAYPREEPTPTPAAPPAAPATTPATQPWPVAESKAQAFDRYAKDPRPEMKMKAYRLAASCLEPRVIVAFAAAQTPPIEVGQLDHQADCGDLKEGQLHYTTRRELLAVAGAAGAKGSYKAVLVDEGPGGTYSMLGDPPMAEGEWKALVTKARSAGLKTADPGVLGAEVHRLADSKSPDDVFTRVANHTAYLINRWKGTELEKGPYSDPRLNPLTQPLIAHMDPETAQKAIDAGKAHAAKSID